MYDVFRDEYDEELATDFVNNAIQQAYLKQNKKGKEQTEEAYQTLADTRKDINSRMNEQGWDDFRRYNIGERVGTPVVNQAIQNGLSVYRNVDEADAERIAQKQELQPGSNAFSRGLGYLVDAYTTQAAINRAIVPAVLYTLGTLGGNVVENATGKQMTGLGPIANKVATGVMMYPNVAKAVTDVALTDRLKTGREHNQGREYNHHYLDSFTGIGGGFLDVSWKKPLEKLLPKDIVDAIAFLTEATGNDYEAARAVTKGVSKAGLGLAKKGGKFQMADTEGPSDEEIEDWIRRYKKGWSSPSK